MIKSKIKYFIVSILFFLFLSIPPVFALEVHLIYDENGNLITGDGKYREYNEFNQLIRVRAGFNNISRILEEYVYHPTEDRILAKKVYDFDQKLVETIIYINDNLVRKINSTGAFDTVYVKDGQGIVAELQQNGKKIYYHNDHLGSTTLITNQSGSVVENTSYAPFGEILSGGNTSRFDYEGKEFSSGSGGYGQGTQDYDFHFRKFDPGLKIFTKPESLFPNLYDPQQLNRYSFERNNPYKYVDKNGKNPALALLAAAAIGGVVGAGFYLFEVATTDLTFSGRGLVSYTAGGAASAFIITGAVLLAPLIATAAGGGAIGAILGGATIVTGGGTGGFTSQLLSNVGTDRPLYQNSLETALFGGVTAGASLYFPTPEISRLKYLKSFITSKIGRAFSEDVALGEFTSNILGFSYNIDRSGGTTGCNPSKQNCNPQTSSSNTGTGNTGGGPRHGCGIDRSCEPYPCKDVIECKTK